MQYTYNAHTLQIQYTYHTNTIHNTQYTIQILYNYNSNNMDILNTEGTIHPVRERFNALQVA